MRLLQLLLNISRSVVLAVGVRCFRTALRTPSDPAAFFGLKFLMAKFSSEIFGVLFIHGVDIFLLFFLLEFLLPVCQFLWCQWQSALSPVQLGNSFAAFFVYKQLVMDLNGSLAVRERLFIQDFGEVPEFASRFREAVFSCHVV